MTTDERNFRSSYYEKVKVDSVEEKKSLNKLLQDNIRNHVKLKQFCLSYTVPTSQRKLLWNIILGILPLHKNSTEFIRKQRCAVYEDLARAVTVMEPQSSKCSRGLLLESMWLLENNRFLYTNSRNSAQDCNGSFLDIVLVLLQIFEDDVETYWIAKEFYACTRDIQKEFPKLKELTESLLKRSDIALYNHLDQLNFFANNEVLSKWYCTCFAGVINESVLIKVWDKVCGGSRKIMIFVFLEMVNTFRNLIFNCNTINDFKSLIEQVKDQDAAIVNKAIKSWQSNKNHNEITVH